MKTVFGAFLSILTLFGNAQVNEDSLWSEWNNEQQVDTNRIKALQALIRRVYINSNPTYADSLAQLQYEFSRTGNYEQWMAAARNSQGVSALYQGNYIQAKKYCVESLELATKVNHKPSMASALNNLGLIHYNQGDLIRAIDCFNKKTNITEQLGDELGSAQTYINLGVLYTSQGNVPKAIDYYHKGLRLYEKLDDKAAISIALSNIGSIYFEQEDFKNALDYFLKSVKISSALNDVLNTSIAYNNIGEVYSSIGKYDEAMEHLVKSLEIKENFGFKKGSVITLNNIGKLHHHQKEYEKAMDYGRRSSKIAVDIEYDAGLALSHALMSDVYASKNEHKKAIEYGNKSLELANKSGSLVQVRDAAKLLYKSYKELGNKDKALQLYELYVANKDSLYNEENRKEIIRQEYKASYDKQALADSLDYIRKKELKDLEHSASLEKEENRRYFLYLSIGALILIGIFIFFGYWRKKKANTIISLQKAEVEIQKVILAEKNKKIVDSITYAKRIQAAVLPPLKLLSECLNDSFVLYKPKDLVAGDFYWLEQKAGKTLFAVADCTGHGVPGAIVSVICNNGLNRSVREHNLSVPGEILDKTREIVIEEFQKSEEVIKDGMDIAICSLEGNQLKFAGAFNPLWLIRNATNEIIEFKGNKQPIGRYDKKVPFDTKSLELQPGDTIYIFSDGFADQFGGEKGKKIKPSGFKKFLLDNADKSMKEQQVLLNEAFESWKGEMEQIDDVCVMGFRYGIDN